MSTTTLGLGYLNEQQRFRREPSRPTGKIQPVIADVSATTRVARPLAGSIDSIVRPHLLKGVPQNLVIAELVVPTQPAAVPTVFSEQFMSEVEAKRGVVVRFLPIAVAAIALISGLTVLGISLRQNHQAAAQVAAISNKSNNATNAESPPSEEPVSPGVIAKYSVAPDMPRLITIKKINVTARIMQLGILKSGALATPRNTNDAGWYDGSSKPGEGGAALIVGHVLGGLKTGVFYNLKKLSDGDLISVERGDGKVVSYKVVKKEQVPSEQVDMSNMLLPVTVGKAGLNIMTCGGKYDVSKETFSDRVIIYTEQV